MKHTFNCLPSQNGKQQARKARDLEFIETYKAALEQLISAKVKNPKMEAVRWTIFNGAPHYHVSYERAYRVVCKILHEKSSPIKPSLQACMWNEIAQRVSSLTQYGRVSVAKALELVLLHCRASRFFISEHYAYANLLPRARHERLARRSMSA
ncbi:MAG: hypothetical protein J6S96_02640 [Muribaculaceae bacterium]|nr:hypothetical protein [Muribaculaceae bacterium]